MDKYQVLNLENKPPTKIQARKQGIGMTPYLVLLFIVITTGVGVFVTYQKIQRKLYEFSQISTHLFIINQSFQQINYVLSDLVKRDIDNQKLIEKKLKLMNTTKKKFNEYQNINFNLSRDITNLDKQITNNKQIINENSKVNIISKQETSKLYKQLKESIKELKTLNKIKSEILDNDNEFDLINNWILSEDISKHNFKKCFSYYNETLDFNKTLENYYKNCIEGNKYENNSLIILYQTEYFDRIGAFLKNKGKNDNQTNFVFNLKNKIKYDIAESIIKISNITFPSFGLDTAQGPYDIRVFYNEKENTIQINTTTIREEEVTKINLFNIEIFILC
jgi:hypothetical protein